MEGLCQTKHVIRGEIHQDWYHYVSDCITMLPWPRHVLMVITQSTSHLGHPVVHIFLLFIFSLFKINFLCYFIRNCVLTKWANIKTKHQICYVRHVPLFNVFKFVDIKFYNVLWLLVIFCRMCMWRANSCLPSHLIIYLIISGVSKC